jgi:hypothetical protein
MTIRKRAIITLAFFGVGFVLAVTRLPLHLPTVCMFKRVTGLPCCGCGMTHAFCALAHGEIEQAADFNLASIPLALIVAAAGLLLLMEAIDNKPRLDPAWRKTQRYIFWGGAPILLIAWMLNLAKIFLH